MNVSRMFSTEYAVEGADRGKSAQGRNVCDAFVRVDQQTLCVADAELIHVVGKAEGKRVVKTF